MIVSKFRKKILSFTLVEMLVVIAIVSIILPTVFGMVYGIVEAQMRVCQLKVAKREGDYFLTIVENKLRNDAVSIYDSSPEGGGEEVCTQANPTYSSNSALYFSDSQGGSFGFYLSSDNRIELEDSNTVSDRYLTSNVVSIKNLDFSCEKKSAYSGSFVGVSFEVEYKKNNNLSKPVLINYRTWVFIRRY